MDEFAFGEVNKIWLKTCRSCKFQLDRLKKYNLTVAQFTDLVRKQKGCCAICDKLASRLVIDHNHSCCAPSTTSGSMQRSCGKCVRELLCVRCNSFVGYMESGPHEKAQNYLEKWST